MTSADAAPLIGKPCSPPKAWAAVSPSATPFTDTTSSPNTTRVAKAIMVTATGSVTLTNLDGSSVTFTLVAGWAYPVIIPGMFTACTAASGTAVYAGFW